MKIVLLNWDNIQLLDEVATEVFDHEIEASKLKAFLDCPCHCMVLAVDDGLVIGMASAVEYFHPDKSPQLWINEVGITPSKRNQGIGRRLVETLLDIGQQRGCVNAWLGTEHGNLAGRRCFASVRNSTSNDRATHPESHGWVRQQCIKITLACSSIVHEVVLYEEWIFI